tara:strand:+ start:17409 stop:18896 length:1488 start_codon:yes stop_codon:yes gene_type:complete
MPFTSGTVQTVTKLLNAMNTHLVANGWTKIRGETDMSCVSPKAARYWRILVWEIESTSEDFRECDMFALKTTLGGSVISGTGTYTCSSVQSGDLALLSSGGADIRSADINDQPWWIMYDHGSPITVREFDYTAVDDNEAPRDFAIQWSNDSVVWTTMSEWNAQSWVAAETKTFSFGDGTLFSEHQTSTDPRRTGRYEDETTNSNLTTSWRRHLNEDVWVWQGDGYDASRRVYLHARGHSRTSSSISWIEWDFAVEHDSLKPSWNTQTGTTSKKVAHLMGSGEIDYWFYSNSKRMILVTRTGSQDYACTYIGFHSAFAVPDDYPFPLSVLTTASSGDTPSISDFDAIFSVPDEVGEGASAVRLWDTTMIYPFNRDASAITNLETQYPTTSWIWPKSNGNNQRLNWPEQWGGDYADNSPPNGWNFVAATAQNDIPFIPATVQHETYGNIGVLDGLFSVPSSGNLTPTQVIAIGGQDYRVFPNRNRRSDSNWFAIRED